jgi:hypothetical protein
VLLLETLEEYFKGKCCNLLYVITSWKPEILSLHCWLLSVFKTFFTIVNGTSFFPIVSPILAILQWSWLSWVSSAILRLV